MNMDANDMDTLATLQEVCVVFSFYLFFLKSGETHKFPCVTRSVTPGTKQLVPGIIRYLSVHRNTRKKFLYLREYSSFLIAEITAVKWLINQERKFRQ
jgi:hypothetical protein